MILPALFTLAQMADLVTADLAREANPIAAGLLTQPLAAFAAKVALVAGACLVAEAMYRLRRYRLVGHAVLLVGTIVGIVGFISNGGLS